MIFIPWSKKNTKKSQRCHLKHIYLTEVGDDAPTMEIGHPKDHWTLKPAYFEDPTPAIQVLNPLIGGVQDPLGHTLWVDLGAFLTLLGVRIPVTN